MKDWQALIIAALAGYVCSLSGLWWPVLVVLGVMVIVGALVIYVLGHLKGFEPESVSMIVPMISVMSGLSSSVVMVFGWSVFVLGIGYVALAYLSVIVVVYVMDALITDTERKETT